MLALQLEATFFSRHHWSTCAMIWLQVSSCITETCCNDIKVLQRRYFFRTTEINFINYLTGSALSKVTARKLVSARYLWIFATAKDYMRIITQAFRSKRHACIYMHRINGISAQCHTMVFFNSPSWSIFTVCRLGRQAVLGVIINMYGRHYCAWCGSAHLGCRLAWLASLTLIAAVSQKLRARSNCCRLGSYTTVLCHFLIGHYTATMLRAHFKKTSLNTFLLVDR